MVMEKRQFLQIPGPTNIPDRILSSLSKPLINHRGPEFKQLLFNCVEGLKKIFKTENDILLFPSSGSGALESVVVNLFSPGDTILVVSLGVFSERMAIIAEKYGVNVIRINKEWGDAVSSHEIKAVLEKDTQKKIKAVCLPQNETTSGITNNIKDLSKVIKEVNHSALLVVDAISSLACIELETDLWEIDVVVSASQKGLMLPPGLSSISVSKKAWKLIDESTLPKWYWDYKSVKSKMLEDQFPYTPATNLLFGLEQSISMLMEEGLNNVWERHELIAEIVRNAVEAMGLELLSKREDASNAVTAIVLPESISYKELAEVLRVKHGVVIGGGLQRLQGKIFRIGHLGFINHLDIYAIMGALEMTLYELGYPIELGTASRSVATTFLNSEKK